MHCEFQHKCVTKDYSQREYLRENLCNTPKKEECKLYWRMKAQEVITGKPFKVRELEELLQ